MEANTEFSESSQEKEKSSQELLKTFLCTSEQTELSEDDIHYVMAFKKFKTGEYVNWNWAAFFLGTANFAYRKNWIAMVISFFAPGIIMRIILVLFSDYLYYMKFKDVCTKARFLSSSEEEQKRYIAQKGGKSLVLGIIIGLLPLIIITAVFFIVVSLAVAAGTISIFL